MYFFHLELGPLTHAAAWAQELSLQSLSSRGNPPTPTRTPTPTLLSSLFVPIPGEQFPSSLWDNQSQSQCCESTQYGVGVGVEEGAG